MWLVIKNCESLELKGSTYTSRSHTFVHEVCYSLLLTKFLKKTFSAAMDQVFLFTFKACSLCLSEEKNKAE